VVVLVVDDDPLICSVLARVFTRSGREVHTCADAGAALAAFDSAAEPFDLLLTDVSMPGEIDGIALAGLVARRCPEMPIVLMSGDTGSLARGGKQAGVTATLAKPFTLDELGDALALASRH
jgi:two-component system NtrC family sensor kinase